MRYVSKGDRLAFWLSAALALGGMIAAFRGEMPWWPGVFFAVCAAALVLWGADLPTYVDNIELSARGIRRTHGPRLWLKKIEAISWEDLTKVEIVTGVPDAEGMSFLLHGSGGPPIAVSDAHVEAEWLLFELQKRLRGFDERSAVEACERAESGRVLVWQKQVSG